ncbi:immunoglobulin superfamily member 22 [Pezoporus occidentalis]|uniref:immunoglobulin superfamily member 22 n=1 Tax=Pezoporus occidentalis TaxID=407982 RepID=UPI002F90997F
MEKRKWVPVECILRSMCQDDTNNYKCVVSTDAIYTVPLIITKAPCPFPGVLIQFVSDLKNTQTKKKGEAWWECVLASEDISLKRMKNGRVIERSPKYTIEA